MGDVRNDIVSEDSAKKKQKIILRIEDKALFEKMKNLGEGDDDAALLSFRDEILNQLGLSVDQWNSDTFEVKLISDDERHVVHYVDRVNSLFDGVKFYLGTIPGFDKVYRDKLLASLTKITEDCIRQMHLIDQNENIRLDISHYQNLLADYSKYVMHVLRSQLDVPKKYVRKGILPKKVDTIAQELARAEEFALAKKHKPTIVTITSSISKEDLDAAREWEMEPEAKEFIAMIDKPENPYADKFDDPEFRAKLLEDLYLLTVMLQHNEPIIEQNTGEELANTYGLEYPDWYVLLDDDKREHLKILLLDPLMNFENIDLQNSLLNQVISTVFPSIKGELRAIQRGEIVNYPDWYKNLKKFEQEMIHSFLRDVDIDKDLGTVMNAISSKLRLIPVPSNYSTHTLITHVKGKDDVAPTTRVESQEKRSSHAASRDVSKRGKKLREIHAKRNVDRMIDDLIAEKMAELEKNPTFKNANVETVIEIPILYQTLITPSNVFGPDPELDEDKEMAVRVKRRELAAQNEKGIPLPNNPNVKVKFTIVSTNHPLNYWKYVSPTTSATVTGSEVSRFLSIIVGEDKRIYGKKGIASISKVDPTKPPNVRQTQLINDIIKRNPLMNLKDAPMVAQACIDLAKYTGNTKLQQIFGPYRELYLSSLEQLIVGAIGGCSIGSCVSGKDRKAIEIAHTDAMKVFYRRFGHLPPATPPALNPEENITEDQKDAVEFAKIFADIYCTKHQQALAGQNAPGSFGTKTPGMYLPDHLRNAVNAWYAAHDKPGTPYKGVSKINTLGKDNRLATNNEITHIKTMLPSIVKRIWKKIRDKKPKHKAPAELTWYQSAMANQDLYNMTEADFQKLNAVAIEGLRKHEQALESPETKNSFFSRSSTTQKELELTRTVLHLLESNTLTSYQKNIVLYTIMASDQYTSLQKVILDAVYIPTAETARYIISSNLKREVSAPLEHLPLEQQKVEYKKAIESIDNIGRNLLDYFDKNVDKFKKGGPQETHIRTILKAPSSAEQPKLKINKKEVEKSEKRAKQLEAAKILHRKIF